MIVAPAPGYDPWMWLLWGREVAGGTLSTAGGPAFKPLPVAVCALLAPLGGAAPWAWVVLARAAAFAAVGLAFVLGRRTAAAAAGASGRQGRHRRRGAPRLAGLLAAAAVALCGAYPTYTATGDVTGLLIALALGGIVAWQAGRPGVALACAVGCALLRVEAWPFVVVLGAVLWRRDRALRPWLVAAAVLVPAAWFVPEWLGSGDLLRSGERALIPNPGQPALADVPALASLRAAADLPLWPLLAAAALSVVSTLAGGHRAQGRFGGAPALVAVGVAWVGLVAAMAQAGFSGEPRYALPGAALIAVAGAIAVGRLPRAARLVAAALVLVVAAPRVAALPHLRAAQAHQWRLSSDLAAAVAAAGGRDAVLRCGTPYVGTYRGPLLAYRLQVVKRAVEPDHTPRPPGVVFRSRLKRTSPVAPSAPAFPVRERIGAWEVRAQCR